MLLHFTTDTIKTLLSQALEIRPKTPIVSYFKFQDGRLEKIVSIKTL